MIVFSRENFCETSNSLFHGDQLAGMACEYLGDLERLRKETLDLTCTAESGNIVLDDGELFFELWTGFPVKFSQELTRPCRDSSQFLVNSFSTFFFSSACNWTSRVLAASLLIRFSNSLLLLSRSAKSFIVSTATACLYDTGSSSGILILSPVGGKPLAMASFRFIRR